MPQLKQRTVEGHKVSLHKYKNPIPEVRNTPFLYEVKINGSTDEERFTRKEADDAFDEVIAHLKRGIELSKQDTQRGHSDGFLGGSGLF